jgi:hypothetical protein
VCGRGAVSSRADRPVASGRAAAVAPFTNFLFFSVARALMSSSSSARRPGDKGHLE